MQLQVFNKEIPYLKDCDNKETLLLVRILNWLMQMAFWELMAELPMQQDMNTIWSIQL